MTHARKLSDLPNWDEREEFRKIGRAVLSIRAISGGPMPDAMRAVIAPQSAQLVRGVSGQKECAAKLESAQAHLEEAMQTL